MVNVDVNYLAVAAGAVSNMVIGFLWFGPLFGKQWMALMGISKEKIDASAKQGMGKLYALAFVGAIVMAYVLSHVITLSSAYFQTSGFSVGLTSGFWMWLGFMAPVTLSTVLWEGKSWKLWFLTNAYWLVSLLVMGVILSVWR